MSSDLDLWPDAGLHDLAADRSGLDVYAAADVERSGREARLGPPLDGPRAFTGRPGPRQLRRRDVYTRPVVDGRVQRAGFASRLRAAAAAALTSGAERAEADLERRLRAHQGVTRPNTIAFVSPKGGVGKTTCTFLAGNLLSSRLQLRVVAVDANSDFGTLASLAPDERRTELTLADLLNDIERVHSAAELARYTSRLPSGLHVLAAPASPDAMARIGPDHYGDLLALLWRYYDVALLDLGTGITEAQPQALIDRADQLVLVTQPEWVTADKVLAALGYLHHARGRDRVTVALNQASARRAAERKLVEAEFEREKIATRVTIPYDDRLRLMLDSGTYALERLDRRTRMAIKRLGLATANHLV